MILVLYPHKDASRCIVRLLGHMGFDAVAIASGEEAIPKMRRQKPSLVILNETLFDMDGLHFLRLLRADPGLADLPVYFMSSTSERREEAESLGIVGYGIKPIGPEILSQVVVNTIGRRNLLSAG